MAANRCATVLEQLASTIVEFDPRFESLAGTKLQAQELAALDPYETGPVKPAAE